MSQGSTIAKVILQDTNGNELSFSNGEAKTSDNSQRRILEEILLLNQQMTEALVAIRSMLNG